MTEIEPRYEFRAWAPRFNIVVARMRRLAQLHSERNSDEIYIVSALSDDNNVKIRDGKIDIKELVQIRDGLE